MGVPAFSDVFHAATGHAPREYQARLAARLVAGDVPTTLDVPTGTGKTAAALVGWLYALAADAASARAQQRPRKVALRLHVATVRRVVVDDTARCAGELAELVNAATTGALAEVAASLREGLSLGPQEPVLEVRRLRGGLGPENGPTEHARHPSRPAIVVGTLDMLCSRLLFRGYQLPPRRRSIDAALTGADSWWVLDEAHLASQAQATLDVLRTHESALEGRFGGTVPGLQVMAMTATPGSSAPTSAASAVAAAGHDVLTWDADEEERRDPDLARRRAARAAVPVTFRAERGSSTDGLVDAVRQLVPSLTAGQSVVVFCTTVATAKKVRTALDKVVSKKVRTAPSTSRTENDVDLELLIGGMPEPLTQQVTRRLAPYRTGSQRREQAPPAVIVATSTLEVGADLDLTHLVTEACGADSLIQRLGRVNRVGARTDGSVTIVHTPERPDPVHGGAAEAVIDTIKDAGTLGEVVAQLRRAPDPAALRRPQQVPALLPPSVLAAYLRTGGSRNDPAVAPWIHEVEDPRAEVAVVVRHGVTLMGRKEGEALLEDLASAPPDLRAEGWTVRLADLPDLVGELESPFVLLDPASPSPRVLHGTEAARSVTSGSVVVIDAHVAAKALGLGDTSRDLDLSQRRLLPEATLEQVDRQLEQLARQAGSDVTGPTTAASPAVVLADLARQAGRLPTPSTTAGQARAEALPELADELETPRGWLLETEVLGEGLDHPWLRISLIRPPEKEPRPRAVALASHSEAVGALAGRWARAIGLPPKVVEDVALAGRWHDEGKGASESFQAALAMREDADGLLAPADSQPARPLAKSALPRRLWRRSTRLAGVPEAWRHEAASARLLDAEIQAGRATPHDADLVRHLVLTHHGFFRGPGPVCVEGGGRGGSGPAALEPYQDPGSTRWRRQVTAVHRLSARYGPYTLALAEAVLRLADWEVSRREQSDAAADAARRHDAEEPEGPSAPRRDQADDR